MTCEDTTGAEMLAERAERWREIATAYEESAEAGRALYKELRKTCLLCKKRTEHFLSGDSGKICGELVCRTCPVVVVTRHTCIRQWAIAGYNDDTFTKGSAVVAAKAARATADFIDHVLLVRMK